MSRRFKLLDVVPLIVNGLQTEGSLFSVAGPMGQNLHHVSATDPQLVGDVCYIAKEGGSLWYQQSISQRRETLLKASSILLENRDVITEAQVQAGINSQFAAFNVTTSVSMIQAYVLELDQPSGFVVNSEATDVAVATRFPIGPVLAMAPWNAPVILTTRSIVAPLVAGCSVVVKSSDKAALLSYFVTKAFLDAGVPKETLQLVHLEPTDAASLVENFIANPHIRKINYTGSTSVGREVAQVAAKHLKPILLELGGKNCSVVEADANITKAASTIIASSFANHGQICMCTDRIYVQESVYDAFLKAAIDSAGNFAQPSFLRSAQATAKTVELVEDALEKGARVEYGTMQKYSGGENIALGPLILSNVTKSMRLNSTETFAPVVAIQKYTDITSVVDDINSNSYGLKAAIWSANVMKAYKHAAAIQCGGVHINGSPVHDEPWIPHGGVKESGTGRFNGLWGVQEFQYVKAITMNEP